MNVSWGKKAVVLVESLFVILVKIKQVNQPKIVTNEISQSVIMEKYAVDYMIKFVKVSEVIVLYGQIALVIEVNMWSCFGV